MQSMTVVKGKNVLKKDPSHKEILSTDIFTVNDNFTSKLYKIKIGTNTAARENDAERIETRENVGEDR